MTEIDKLFERQSAWQKQQASLRWSEKIRMAEAVRESVARLSRVRRAVTVPSRQGASQSIASPPGARKNWARR